MEYILVGLSAFIGWGIGLFSKQFFPSYMKEKGKNVATKEDIEEITRLTENVKTEFQMQLESHKRNFEFELEQLKLQQDKLYTNFELFTVKSFLAIWYLFKEL